MEDVTAGRLMYFLLTGRRMPESFFQRTENKDALIKDTHIRKRIAATHAVEHANV